LLDGFTVTGGLADGSYPHDSGGGMVNWSSSPTVRHCTFEGNEAITGGGMQNWSSSPKVLSCTFANNVASLYGGGMNNHESTPIVTDCIFYGNTAADDGGAMDNYQGSPTVTSCVFYANSAGRYGGAMDIWDGSATVTSCTFYENAAGEHGGGLFSYESSPTVTNGVLWANAGGEIVSEGSSVPTVTYSDVEGGYAGDGNIDADPLFLGAPDDLHLGYGSPCIDAANGPVAPELDLDGNPRVDDPDSPNTGEGPPWADMGAYEYQPSW